MSLLPQVDVSQGLPTSSEQRLSEVLSEFARTMVTDFPIQAILDHLVKRIVDVLPISAAGVTLISPGADPRYVAASDESALRFEELQTEFGEGPCLIAYRTGSSFSVSDLRDDSRFPKFAPQALRAGLIAAFTFPLRSDGGPLGALDLYRDTPGPLDSASMYAAQTLADVAAAYLLNAQARAALQDSSERSLERSLHDALTGLPNRALLLERLGHAALRSSRSGLTSAVLFMDLDRFKQVNDLYGHAAGDELLVAVAQRLSAVLRPGDTLARISGDEFVILCEDLDQIHDVDTIATRIHLALKRPFVISGCEVEVTASIGIAFSSRSGHPSEQLLSDADAAMYEAKRAGGARHRLAALSERKPTVGPVSMDGYRHGGPMPLTPGGPTDLVTERQDVRAAEQDDGDRVMFTDHKAISVRVEQHGHVARLHPSGEIDLATAPVVEAWLTRAESNGNAAIVVDLEQVTFMDVSGLRVFLAAADRAHARGHSFAIINASSAVEMVLQITGTTHLLGAAGATGR